MQQAHQRAKTISVFIAEDHAAVRERIVALLTGTGLFQVVGEAGSPAEAIEGILRTRPDAVVLDIHLLGGNGLQVVKSIHPLRPDVHFVVLTNHPNAQYRKAFMAAGADCVLDKSTEFPNLPQTLQQAHRRCAQ